MELFSGYSNTSESSDDDFYQREAYLSDCTGIKAKFHFPPPPRLSVSASQAFSSESLTSSDEIQLCRTSKSKNKIKRQLPPLGIFWDIENCHVPKAKSASAVVAKIRSVFLKNHRESDFVVVCDVKKEQPHIIQELHDSQVNLIHVSSTSKNAADEKLRQSLRRFAEVHPAPASIVLISGDINFASDLSDLRYRKKIRVILVHNVNVADALILCANEHHSFAEITGDLPEFKTKQTNPSPSYMVVENLPLFFDHKKIRNRLKLLTDNCGGREITYTPETGVATIKFFNLDAAKRAQRRIQGEDVCGNKIHALTPTIRNYAGRKVKNDFQSYANYSIGCGGIQDGSFRRPNDNLLPENAMFRPIRGAGSGVNGAGSQNPSPMDVSYDNSSNWANNYKRGGNQRQRNLQDVAGALPIMNRVHKISSSSDFSDEGKMYNSDSSSKTNQNDPVDLVITNLDSTIDIKEMKRLLSNMFKEYAMIISLNITVNSDGSHVANIRVNSQQEAQFAISQLHRKQLGSKRLIISYAQNNAPNPDELKAMVIGLLQEVPDKKMPLFKIIQLLGSRFHCFVSLSDIKKLKDTCKITEEMGARYISLTQEFKASPPPNLCRTILPYCSVHYSNLQSRGWCEISDIQTPPTLNVMMSLHIFSAKLNDLLSIHNGCLPLLSFQNCYEQVINEPLPVNENGVPLEHLITCVPQIEIKCVGPNKNIKIITKQSQPVDCSEESVLKTVPSPLAPNINLLCRELVDLLKTTEKCQLLLNKFIPAYHHHFGRQCRVAEYGYTKLLDLFESIPHVIQIMGYNTRRVITLTHNSQMRRFTSDLLRVLKVQPLKQISMSDFPNAYEKVMNKSFSAVEYGLCTFEDLLQEVPKNTIVISKTNEGILISVPKREQTPEEMMRTKQFANEVVDLLKHAPDYTMRFNNFVPSYHHNFGHQCKVSDYGFSKLIELFEAIPETVKIEELSNGERAVSLTLEESIKILGSQIVQAIKNSSRGLLPLEDIPNVYLREFGYPLKPQIYGCETVEEVIEQLPDYIEVIHSNAGTLLVAIDMDTIPTLMIRGWALLLQAPHSKELFKFRYEYQSRYNSSFANKHLEQLSNVFKVTVVNNSTIVELTALFILAAQLYHVIFKNRGSAPFDNLEKLYFDYFDQPLQLANYNIHSVNDFYNQFNLFFCIRGKKRSMVFLKRNLAEHLVPLPTAILNSSSQFGINKREVPWPSLPTTELLPTRCKVSPPKPDSPPTPENAAWSSHWSPQGHETDSKFLSIPLPIVHNPQLLGNPSNLISPNRSLMPSNRPWNSLMEPVAPDPAELPMPDKLITKGVNVSDDSNDSGVNTKLEISPSESELDVESFHSLFGAKSHFSSFFNFNNNM